MAPSLVGCIEATTNAMAGRGRAPKKPGRAKRTTRTATAATSSAARVSSPGRGREEGGRGANVPPTPAGSTRSQVKLAKQSSSHQPGSTAAVSHDVEIAMDSVALGSNEGSTTSKATGRQAERKGTSSKPLETVDEEALEDTAATTSDAVGELVSSEHHSLNDNAHV